jgi:K+-transporting ATPase A subunit
VSIGEGLPTSKAALLQVVISLSKMTLPDEQTGQPRTLLSYQQVQKLMEDIIGIPISQMVPEAQAVAAAQLGPNGGTNNQNVSGKPAPVQNPYIDGAATGGTMSGTAVQPK